MSKKILVVDDEPDIVKLLEIQLKNCGYDVISAVNAKEALSRIEDGAPDLMILDLMLPDFSGEEVCREVRKNENNIPIIMLTAKGEDVDRIVGKVVGANFYLTKPFNPHDLLKKIYKLLENKGNRQRS